MFFLTPRRAGLSHQSGRPRLHSLRGRAGAQPDVARRADGVPPNLTFGFVGPLNIELVEPIEGTNIYTEFLATQPMGGLHHVAWKVDDIDSSRRAMTNAGMEEVQAGRFGAGTRFSYFDTRQPLGHFTELLYFDEETEALFAQLRGAAA
jgi:catechol 2,3-dioxygenase-like lactoylglutathione lyase family enzyme